MKHKSAQTKNPVVWSSSFCSACGLILPKGKVHACEGGVHGTYCTQCGNPKHEYVCYPDPRRTE